MANVEANFNSIGVSELLFRRSDRVRTGLVSGMVFQSGAQLIFYNGTTVVILG